MYSISKDQFLTPEETLLLTTSLTAAHGLTVSRDALLIELALFTGARSAEVLLIDVQDINFKDSSIFLRGVKGSDNRELPLSPELLIRLKRHIRAEGLAPQARLFDICTRRFRQIWAHYKPCDKSLHSLRHTFAIELFKRHRDIRLVQFALGHRNINNTMVYSEYIYKLTELKKLFPVSGDKVG